MKKVLFLLLSIVYYIALYLTVFEKAVVESDYSTYTAHYYNSIPLRFFTYSFSPIVIYAYLTIVFVLGIVLTVKKKYRGMLISASALLSAAIIFGVKDIGVVGVVGLLILFTIITACILLLFKINTKIIVTTLVFAAVIFMGLNTYQMFNNGDDWYLCDDGSFYTYPHNAADASSSRYTKDGKFIGKSGGFTIPTVPDEELKPRKIEPKCNEVRGSTAFSLYLKTIGK
jgi:hypothetical protein